MRDGTVAHESTSTSVAEPPKESYHVFSGPGDILYAPEEALVQGLHMVKTLKANVKKLELGNKLRKEVWLREIERSVCIHTSSLKRVSYFQPWK